VKKGHTNLHFRKGNQTTESFTEATLLRAMETAGKQVDDEDLRELMKTVLTTFNASQYY
jgi:DNA topoisomerase-3